MSFLDNDDDRPTAGQLIGLANTIRRLRAEDIVLGVGILFIDILIEYAELTWYYVRDVYKRRAVDGGWAEGILRLSIVVQMIFWVLTLGSYLKGKIFLLALIPMLFCSFCLYIVTVVSVDCYEEAKDSAYLRASLNIYHYLNWEPKNTNKHADEGA